MRANERRWHLVWVGLEVRKECSPARFFGCADSPIDFNVLLVERHEIHTLWMDTVDIMTLAHHLSVRAFACGLQHLLASTHQRRYEALVALKSKNNILHPFDLFHSY